MTTKDELLGENYSTAANKLRKLLLFELAKQLKLTTCFRCQKDIKTIREFSIEHKEPWQAAESPSKAFYDLDNIAFSHLQCNSGAANREKQVCPKGHPLEPRTGTNRRLCPICRREYMRGYIKQYRKENGRTAGGRRIVGTVRPAQA